MLMMIESVHDVVLGGPWGGDPPKTTSCTDSIIISIMACARPGTGRPAPCGCSAAMRPAMVIILEIIIIIIIIIIITLVVIAVPAAAAAAAA